MRTSFLVARGVTSIRSTLQSTSLLAVLAGYVVLLGANHFIAKYQREQSHAQHVDLLRQELLALSIDTPRLDARLRQLWLPGFRVKRIGILSSQPLPAAVMSSAAGEQWLETVIEIPTQSGSRVWYRLSENVTTSVRQELLGQMLLSIAAGVSSLITSALLRPVLRNGLVIPLNKLSIELDSTNASSAGPASIEVLSQPLELQSIARSFNELQDRIGQARRREREFVDGVAHELRTPITLISGLAQRLLRCDLPSDAQSALLKVVGEVNRMTSLVSALLDLARQDSGRLQLLTVAFAPDEQILIAYERLKPASDGRLRLMDLGEISQDILASGDPDRLQQCLAALVENALVYSPGPSAVVLSLSVNSENVVFHVVDGGPGVVESEKLRIFERFSRGSASESVRGSGIGLAVVYELMIAMGGAVDVVDAEGGGADFRLHFSRA